MSDNNVIVAEIYRETITLVVALGVLGIMVIDEDEIRQNFAAYCGARGIFWRHNHLMHEGMDTAFTELACPLPKMISSDRRAKDGKMIYWPTTFSEKFAGTFFHGLEDKDDVLESARIFFAEVTRMRKVRDEGLRRALRQMRVVTG